MKPTYNDSRSYWVNYADRLEKENEKLKGMLFKLCQGVSAHNFEAGYNMFMDKDTNDWFEQQLV